MSTMDKINKLNNLRQSIEQGGDETQVNKLHSEGKFTARERINFLLDSDSFVEIGGFVKHRTTDFNMNEKDAPYDGVVTGYGTIEGRLVYVYSQDSTILGGSVGEMHSKKIVNIYELAMKMGAPVIALLDSKGLRLQEAVDGLNGYGSIFYSQSLASGVIPQITLVLGDCAGGSSIIPGLSDFTFMIQKNAKLFMNSPNTMEKEADFEKIASADIHSKKSGMVDFVCPDEETCFTQVRLLVDLLPSNNMEDAPILEATDDLNRVSSELNSIVPENTMDGFDVTEIIKSIADNNIMVQVSEHYGKSLITGLIRLDGGTVGVIANQSIENEGYMDSTACEKGAKFINFCDSFNIPIVSLTDTAGFKPSINEEQNGLSKKAAKFVYALAHSTIPKVNVIVRKAFGSAYVVMNSKHIGADIVFAWPSAQIAVMNSDSAVRIMYADQINNAKNGADFINEKVETFEEMQASPYTAAGRGYVDDVIEPAATRKRIIAAIEMLISKRDNRPAKKHGTVL